MGWRNKVDLVSHLLKIPSVSDEHSVSSELRFRAFHLYRVRPRRRRRLAIYRRRVRSIITQIGHHAELLHRITVVNSIIIIIIHFSSVTLYSQKQQQQRSIGVYCSSLPPHDRVRDRLTVVRDETPPRSRRPNGFLIF